MTVLYNQFLTSVHHFHREELVRPSFGRKNRTNFPDFNEFNPSEMAGLRKAVPKERNVTLVDKGVGNWEKHTKGIGAKLLLQVNTTYF